MFNYLDYVREKNLPAHLVLGLRRRHRSQGAHQVAQEARHPEGRGGHGVGDRLREQDGRLHRHQHAPHDARPRDRLRDRGEARQTEAARDRRDGRRGRDRHRREPLHTRRAPEHRSHRAPLQQFHLRHDGRAGVPDDAARQERPRRRPSGTSSPRSTSRGSRRRRAPRSSRSGTSITSSSSTSSSRRRSRRRDSPSWRFSPRARPRTGGGTSRRPPST